MVATLVKHFSIERIAVLTKKNWSQIHFKWQNYITASKYFRNCTIILNSMNKGINNYRH